MNKPDNYYAPWADDDLERLREMTAYGTPVRVMAAALGRTEASVYRRKGIQRFLTPSYFIRNANAGTATNEHYLRACGSVPVLWSYAEAKALHGDLEAHDAARDARDAISYPHLAAEYAIEAARWRNGG